VTAPEGAPRPRPRPAREPVAAPAPRSSKLGGILLIVGAVLVVGVVLAFVILSGGDEEKPSTTAASPTATPTATATPRVVGQVPLTGAGSASKAKGTMTLYLVGRQLGFQIQGQDVPANGSKDRYAVWFTGPGGKADLIGVATDPVGQDGALGVAGPPANNAQQFPKQLSGHRNVVVSRETKAGATQPGPIVLRGKLPTGSS